MRPTVFLALLACASAAPVAAQGIVLPIRCAATCPRTLTLDSVKVWAHLERGQAVTYVDYVIRNPSADSVEGAFFFPLPADAEISRVALRGRELELYNEWSRPEEARWMLDGLARERPGAGLAAYAGARVVHVRVPSIAPGGVKHLQVGYSQPLRAEGGTIAYRFPLSVGAGAAPVGHLALGMTVKTEAGFTDLRSTSHAVRVEWGTESGRCPPRARCGYRSVPSRRVKVVRLEHAADVRRRDFELVYTPVAGGSPAAERP